MTTKQEFLDRHLQLLDRLEDDIKKLSDDASSLAARLRQGVEPEIHALETKRRVLIDQLADLEADDSETWKLVRRGVKRSVSELQNRLDRTEHRVRARPEGRSGASSDV